MPISKQYYALRRTRWALQLLRPNYYTGLALLATFTTLNLLPLMAVPLGIEAKIFYLLLQRKSPTRRVTAKVVKLISQIGMINN